MKKKIRYFLIGFLVVLIGIQFIQIDKSNPESDPGMDIFVQFEASPEMTSKIKEACYDCHSNQTEFPWYTSIQPFGWWIKKHIDEGRKHLNFSEFNSYTAKKAHHKLEECVEYVHEGWMPLESFVRMHPEAKLSDLERSEMVAWFKENMDGFPEI